MAVKAIQLPSGYSLAYAEYGKSDGVPVFSFHGTPGARLCTPTEVTLATEAGIRLIRPDRPGYGYSDFQPERTLLDWADDVVALADTLGIDTFGIMGFSGGGPHAVACAFKIPQRLTHVALVSALGPVVLLGESRKPMTHERREFKANQIKADPEAWLQSFINNISGPDGEQIKAQGAWRVDLMQEAYRQGVAGAVYDETLILTQAWGFDLADITADVHIWQGEMDANVALHHAQYMADHIPNATLTYVPQVGHLMPPATMQAIFRLFTD